MERRSFLSYCVVTVPAGAALNTGLLTPRVSLAEESDPFQATSVDAVLKALGITGVEASDLIAIKTPKIAENGAAVPLGISSTIEETTAIIVIVAANPKPLAARYRLGKGAAAFVDTRVKLGQTTEVIAVAKAGGKYYMATTQVKVTLGGCGG